MITYLPLARVGASSTSSLIDIDEGNLIGLKRIPASRSIMRLDDSQGITSCQSVQVAEKLTQENSAQPGKFVDDFFWVKKHLLYDGFVVELH